MLWFGSNSRPLALLRCDQLWNWGEGGELGGELIPSDAALARRFWEILQGPKRFSKGTVSPTTHHCVLSAEDMRCWNLSQSQRKPAPAAHTSANPSRVNRYLAQHLPTTRSIPVSDNPIPFPIYFLFISYSISYSFPIGNFLFPIHFHDLEEENLHFFNNAKMNRK